MGGLDGLIQGHLVSLKVCELCGKLYGQHNKRDPYCPACEFDLRDFPAPVLPKPRGVRIEPGVHGLRQYRRGCRCGVCVIASQAYQRERYRVDRQKGAR